MNQMANFSIGKIESRFISNALGIKKGELKTIPEILKIFNTSVGFFAPKSVQVKYDSHSDTEGYGHVKKCYLWEEIKKASGEKEHVCACVQRSRGLLDTFGIKGKVFPVKRFPDGDTECLLKVALAKES